MSLLDQGLSDQANAIASGEADPEELLEQCLERIEERNPGVNAVVATFPHESRRMLADALPGPLHGVPVVIKDEWPLPWRAEQFGAADNFAEMGPGESGPYRALRDAGAVIVGVANMHEHGASSTGAISVYGPARNPWNVARCPGGSSSGPAAAVAAGIVAGAVGADGLGSIRYPAAYCGLTGLKTTFARATNEGHHLADSTQTIVSGPLCADAGDCRLLASVLFGEELSAGEPGEIRVGVVTGDLWEDTYPGVEKACREGLDALVEATGAEVKEVTLSDIDLTNTAAVLVAQSEEAAHLTPANLNGLSKEVSPLARGLAKVRMLTSATAVDRAKFVRARFRRELARLFEQVDVIAMPTVPSPAPPLEDPTVQLPSEAKSADLANARYCTWANLSGAPAISVPVGLVDDLPVALQLGAAWGRDELLLDLAEALERATDRRFVEARAPIAA